MKPAVFNPPFGIKRGDTLQAWEIATLTNDDGTPVGITSARMQLRTPDGAVVYEWSTAAGNMTLTGETATLNTLTLLELEPATTALFPVATLNYDLEVTFESGEVGTPMAGSITVDPDITR